MGFWHARGAQRVGARVVAVVDRDEGAARRIASRFPGCAALTTSDELLSRVKPLVVHVCTPPETHQDIANQGMDAGAHLIIEKPVTPAAADTARLLRRAAERGVLVCPVHQYLFQRGVLRAAALLPGIGPPLDVQAVFCSAGGGNLPLPALDSIAADILPHPLSLIARLFEDGLSPDPLNAVRLVPGELRASWNGGPTAFSIVISMNGRPTCATLRVVGTKGTLHLDLFHGFAFLESGQVSRMRKLAHPFELGTRMLAAASANLADRVITWEPAYPGLRALIEAFYRAVRMGAPPPVSAEEVLAVAQTRDRILSGIAKESVS
jgi:predicted dehydrogenase